MFVTKAIFILAVCLAATGATMTDRKTEPDQAPDIRSGYTRTSCEGFVARKDAASQVAYANIDSCSGK